MSSTTTVRAEGSVAHIVGKAWLRHADGSQHEIRVGDRVAEGQIIVTDANSSVDLRGAHGDMIAIGEAREVLADANLLAQDPSTPQEAAVKPPDGDFERALSALNSGTDPFANLDPTGAGLGTGGDSESHGFVRLFRISETLDPLSVPTVSSTFERPLVDVTGGHENTTQRENQPPVADPLNVKTPEDHAIDISLAGVVHDPDGDPTSVVGTPNAGHGTVTVNPDGSLHYTPNPDYNGPDTITYTVTDGKGGQATGKITIDVTPVNDAPVAQNQHLTTPEDTPISGRVAATDVDGNTLSFAKGSDPAHGTVTVNQDGTFTYTPDKDYNGSDHFTVIVDDGNGGKTTATVDIGITPVQDSAVITGQDAGAVKEDVTLAVSGKLDVTDPDAGEAHFNAATIQDGHYGSLTIDANGNWTYTLNNADPAVQSLKDGDTLTRPITVTSVDGTTHVITVTIEGTNETATTGAGTVQEDTTLTASGTLVATGVATFVPGDHAGTYGSLHVDANGGWTYTLNNGDPAVQALVTGDTRVETFTVQLNDGGTTTVTINVLGLDDGAVIVPHAPGADAGLVKEDVTLAVSGKLDVTDPDAGQAHFNAATIQDGHYGSLTIDANGNWTYTLNNADPAVQSLKDGDTLTRPITVTSADGTTHVITVTIEGTNETATTGAGTVQEDTTLTASGTLVATGVATFVSGDHAGSYGSLHVDANGGWTYTLNNSDPVVQALGNNDSRVETFTVQLDDGSTTTVTINVLGLNDAPTYGGNWAQSTSTPEDTPLVFSSQPGHYGISVNDVDGDTLTTTVTVLYGTLTANPGSGAAIAGDGTHQIVLTGTAAQINAALDGLTYTPVADSNTGDRISVSTSDGSTTVSLAPMQIGIVPVQDAFGDTATTHTGNSVSIDVLANDTFSNPDHAITAINGQAIANDGAVAVQHGTVTLHNGQLVFTPETGYTGSAIFTYTVSSGGTDETASVAVSVINGNPVTVNDTAQTLEDTPLTMPVATLLANDTDPDGDTLTITSVQNPTHGTVALVGNNVVFTPDANYNGPASFTYTASDGHGGTSTATVNIVVTPVNDAPVTADQNLTTPEDTPLLGTVVATDVDGDALTFSKGSDPAHGTVVVNADGSFVYTPSKDYNGSDSFTVTVDDGHGGTTTATIHVGVTPVNDPPVADNPNLTTYEDTPVSGKVTATDVDGDTLTFTKGNDPAHGSVTINADGSFTYTPAKDYNGSDSFTVTVNDGHGGTTTSTITIGVTPVNDAPVPTLSVAPVGQWTFNEGSGTTTTNGYSGKTGTLSDLDTSLGGNATPVWSSGHNSTSGQALTFDGQGSYVKLDSSVGDTLGGTATLTAWINTTQKGSATTTAWNNPSIIGSEEIGYTRDIQWGAIDSAGHIGIGVGNSAIYSNAVVADGQWHQVSISRSVDAKGVSTVSIYVDGVLDTTGTIAPPGDASNGVILNHLVGFGVTNGWQATSQGSTSYTDTTAGDVYFKGSLDDIHVYSSALTAAQLKAIYLVENGFENTAVANDGQAVHLNLAAANYTGLTVTGLEAGMTISDGHGHSATSTGWTLDSIQIGGVGASGTATESATLIFNATNTVNGETHDATTYLNIVSDKTLLAGTSANDTLDAHTMTHAMLISGGDGNDTLIGGSGHDRLIGGNGDDKLDGGAGNDVLIGGAGNDTLTGGLGNNTFVWQFGDQGTVAKPAVDTVTDFGQNGKHDVLDLRDLLQGENHVGNDSGNLTQYLHFEHSGNDTVIDVSTSGGFTNGNYVAGAVDQRIVLTGVDLTQGGTLTNDQQIISDLLKNGKLHTD